MRDGWRTVWRDGALTLSRGAPGWDIAERAAFPPARPLRLASQIRQDMWRALRRLRGFRPAVHVAPVEGGLMVTAGGAVEGAVPMAARAAVAALLIDPGHRRRWLAQARR